MTFWVGVLLLAIGAALSGALAFVFGRRAHTVIESSEPDSAVTEALETQARRARLRVVLREELDRRAHEDAQTRQAKPAPTTADVEASRGRLQESRDRLQEFDAWED